MAGLIGAMCVVGVVCQPVLSASVASNPLVGAGASLAASSSTTDTTGQDDDGDIPARSSVPSKGGCDAVIDGLENPFKNCGFENGLSGWQPQDTGEPFHPLSVATAGLQPDPLLSFFGVEPTEGQFAAVHGFDGAGPATIELAQTVDLPLWATTLEFDYRAAWDFAFGTDARLDRNFSVVLRSTTNGETLASHPVMRAEAGSFELDSGARRGSVDLSAFAGTQVNVGFAWNIPESGTGPGWFQLDNVRLALPRKIGCGLSLTQLGPSVPSGSADRPPHWFRLKLPRQLVRQTLLLDSPQALIDVHALGGARLTGDLHRARLNLEPLSSVPASLIPEPKGDVYLISAKAADSPIADRPGSLKLTATCISGRNRTFDHPDQLKPSNDTVGSARWHSGDTCPAAALPGHSGRGVARWGNPNACTNYATAAGTTDQLIEPFVFGVHGNDNSCPSSRQRLAFNYFLDLEDGPAFDRARVQLHFNDGQFITVLDNGKDPAPTDGSVDMSTEDGATENTALETVPDPILEPEPPGLISGTGQWLQATVLLPLATETTPTLREVRFIAETSDDLNNWGRGFLIDDVRIECSAGELALFDFETGELSS